MKVTHPRFLRVRSHCSANHTNFGHLLPYLGNGGDDGDNNTDDGNGSDGNDGDNSDGGDHDDDDGGDGDGGDDGGDHDVLMYGQCSGQRDGSQ